MRTSVRFAPLLGLLTLLAGCTESDTTTGPDPVPTGPPVIRQFTVAQSDVVHGEWTQLNWKIDGARSASITPDIGLLQSLAVGAQPIRPIVDITYTLTASNEHGTSAATISITVTYRSGVYVDFSGGNDANSGSTPQDPISTLTEAFARTQGGGTLFVAAGTYPAASLVIDGPRRLIYGGLNPDTFLQEEDFQTILRPSGGTPLEIRGPSSQLTVLDHVVLDAQGGGPHALSVENAPVLIQDCRLNGTKCGSGTAVRISGDAEVTLLRSWIRGGENDVSRHDDAIGIRVQDNASVLVRDCFISGGYALQTSSGVDVDTFGSVALGLNTISAGVLAGGQFATPIRIRNGRPAIGGNILFTRGSGRRPAVIEEAADADPSWFHANLILGVSVPIYDNHTSDGADPVDEAGVNNYQLINDDVGTVGENLFRILAPSQMMANVDHFDYHLVNPLTTGGPNPAIDSMPRVFDGSLYGLLPTEQPRDIDGQNRPNSYRDLDRGADEY